MTPDELKARIAAKVDEIRRFRNEDLPDIIGNEAVRHYREGFVNEGATTDRLNPWADVVRRDPNSKWYGHQSGNKGSFSAARAADKILTGETGELQNSITYEKKSDRVSVYSDKPYAAVHQFGLNAKIYGKKEFTMTARPFIVNSDVLNRAIYDKMERELKRILEL